MHISTDSRPNTFIQCQIFLFATPPYGMYSQLCFGYCPQWILTVCGSVLLSSKIHKFLFREKKQKKAHFRPTHTHPLTQTCIHTHIRTQALNTYTAILTAAVLIKQSNKWMLKGSVIKWKKHRQVHILWTRVMGTHSVNPLPYINTSQTALTHCP